MLDVDHVKLFNDRHGHPAGDEALRAFGAVLQSCMRGSDLAARYGGEEFAVLLPRADDDAVGAIAERIRARTEATIIALAGGVTDHITVSIGIASAPEHGLDRVTLCVSPMRRCIEPRRAVATASWPSPSAWRWHRAPRHRRPR